MEVLVVQADQETEDRVQLEVPEVSEVSEVLLLAEDWLVKIRELFPTLIQKGMSQLQQVLLVLVAPEVLEEMEALLVEEVLEQMAMEETAVSEVLEQTLLLEDFWVVKILLL
jgi:hypothetical protein